jgi:hypothetical protein
MMLKPNDVPVTQAGLALLLSAMLLALTACGKPAGPAEQAGKKIDQAVEKAGQQVEKVGDSIQDTAKGEKK